MRIFPVNNYNTQKQKNQNITFSGITVSKWGFNSINKPETLISRARGGLISHFSEDQIKKLKELGLDKLGITRTEYLRICNISHDAKFKKLFNYYKKLLINAEEYTFWQISKAKKTGTLQKLLSDAEVLPTD